MQRYSTLKTRTSLKQRKPWNPVRKAWGSSKPLKATKGFKKTGSTLKTHTPLKAKKNIRKVGKVGKANMKARKMIAQYSEKHKLEKCELSLTDCLKNWALAPAHRHKRAWYKGDADLLADPAQWVVGCVVCHDQIEHDEELTKEIFLRLRGPEVLPTNLLLKNS